MSTFRVWLLALLSFALMGSAWGLALPVRRYLRRGAAPGPRVRGDQRKGWLPRGHVTDRADHPVDAYLVPASLLPEDVDCTWYRVRRAASCQHPTRNNPARVWLPTTAARAEPGVLRPGRPAAGSQPGLRRGTGGPAALRTVERGQLLAWAVAIGWRCGNRLLVIGIGLAASPMAMNLTGAVNPNGLEIAAGVLLFTALLALIRRPAIRTGPPGLGLCGSLGPAGRLPAGGR